MRTNSIGAENSPSIQRSRSLTYYSKEPSIIVTGNEGNATTSKIQRFKKKLFDLTTRSTKFTILGFLYMAIVMIIGILTVYFTSQNRLIHHCTYTYTPMLHKPIQLNSRTQSVALGDFNQDQKLDIVTANYGANNIGIMLGYGNGTFANSKTLSTGWLSRPSSVVVGDFNNDHQLDIAVTNFGSNNLGIFLGYGNGTFSNQQITTTKNSRPLSIAIGDFNGDTRIDIIVVNYGTNSIGVLLGFGNGTFAYPTIYSTGFDSDPRSIVVADLNKDSHLDLVVANRGTNNIAIFLGNTDGTFANYRMYSTGSDSCPYSIAIGDLNNDHYLDIIVANSGSDNIGLFFGYGNGTYREQMTFSTETYSRPHSVVTGDLNNDNISDIAVAYSQKHMIGVFLGEGDGRFLPQVTYSTGYNSEPQFLMLGKVNNDLLIDIVVANNGTNDVGVLLAYIWLKSKSENAYVAITNYTQFVVSTVKSNNDISMNLLERYGNESFSHTIKRRAVYVQINCVTNAAGDFNNDNKTDMVIVKKIPRRIDIFLGYGNGSFIYGFYILMDSSSYPCSVVVSDFNRDNHMDIGVTDYKKGNLNIFLGHGDGSFAKQPTISISTQETSHFVTVADFNNDYIMDLAVIDQDRNNINIYRGYGNGLFKKLVTYLSEGDFMPFALSIADFNHDGYKDLAVVNSEKHTMGILLGYGNGSFHSQMLYSTGDRSYPHSVAMGDFNNDTHVDLAVANRGASSQYSGVNSLSNSFSVAIFLNDGNGLFSMATSYSTGYNSLAEYIAVGDFNNDHHIDLAIAKSSNTNNVGIFLGFGNGLFTQQIILSTNSSYNGFIIADFNNDKRMDIAVGGSNDLSILLLYSYEIVLFKEIMKFPAAHYRQPDSLVIADFNQDNKLDLGVSYPESNEIGLLFGYGNLSFHPEKILSSNNNAYPRFLMSADLNGDNMLDILVANTGSNSIGLFFASGNGSFENQKIYSLDSNSQPLSIAVGDFNNDHRLDIAFVNYGTNSIGLLLGYDIGKFERHAVFTNQEEHSFQAIAIDDLNNDGRMDAVVVSYVLCRMDILLGTENKTLVKYHRYDLDCYPSSVAVSDFNQDHNIDIVIAIQGTSVMVGGEMIAIYLGYGNGTFHGPVIYFTGGYSNPCSLIIADFNNDHFVDIAVANSGTNNIGIFFGYGDGLFTVQVTYSTGIRSYPIAMVMGDFNNDNKIDLAVVNHYLENVRIFLGDGNGSFADQLTFSTGPGSKPEDVAIGDFNNDNHTDLGIVNSGTNTLSIFQGYGNGSFQYLTKYSTGNNSYPYSITVGDLNNDGRLDIIVVNRDTVNIGLFLGIGDGYFSTERILPTNSLYPPLSVMCIDWNGDNRTDLLALDAAYILTFFGIQEDGFLNGKTFSSGNNSFPRFLSIADFNNDHNLDIVVANSGNDNVGVFLGYGNGYFAHQMMYTTGNGSVPYFSVVDDLNNDTQRDIVVANYGTHSISVFLGYGNGSFTQSVTYSIDSLFHPTSLSICDFNNDKRSDIVMTSSGSNELFILFGIGDGTFVNETKISMGYGAMPMFLACSDMNDDQRSDIAVVNYGFKNIEVYAPVC